MIIVITVPLPVMNKLISYMYATYRLSLNPTLQNLEIGTQNVEAVKDFMYLGSQANST